MGSIVSINFNKDDGGWLILIALLVITGLGMIGHIIYGLISWSVK
jgi:hypothetical protein